MIAYRGDLARASALLKPLVSERAPPPGALFVGACVALEANELDRATALATQLSATDPERAAVLREFIGRRRARPKERVNEALAAAWKAAGRPDLSASPIKRPTLSQRPGVANLARLTEAERIFFALYVGAEKHPELDRILAVAAQASTNPLYVNFDELTWLESDHSDTAALTVRKQAAVRKAAGAVAAADSENGYLQLVAILAGVGDEVPLAPTDVASIEAALALPRFVQPRARLFEELRAATSRLDPECADYWAFNALALFPPVAPLTLEHRAEATPDPDLRLRASRAAAAAADRLAQSGTELDLLMDVSIAKQAARLSGDAKAMTLAEGRGERENERFTKRDAAAQRLGWWPLPSLWREHLPDYAGELADRDLLVE